MIRYRLQNYDIENKEQTKKLYYNNNYSNIFFYQKIQQKYWAERKNCHFYDLSALIKRWNKNNNGCQFGLNAFVKKDYQYPRLFGKPLIEQRNVLRKFFEK